MIYADYSDYFKELATKHVDVKHDDLVPGNKKFFQMSIEEFYSGASGGLLPAPSAGPFVILLDYVSTVKYTGGARDHREFMIQVLQGVSNNQHDDANTAKNTCEGICNDFIAKMVEDSQNGLPIFQHSLDKADMIKKVPGQIIFQSPYVGFQMSFETITSFNDCVDNTKWLP